MTYTSLFMQSIGLYSEGKYEQAYQLVTEQMHSFKDFETHLYNLRYCTACMAGHRDLAIQILKEAILEKGYWYSVNYLNQEEDIKSIRDTEEYLELAELCRQRELEARESAKPSLITIKPLNFLEDRIYPLMLILHGNGQSALIAEENWNTSANKDFLLALPQSSQPQFSDSYIWTDYVKGAEEVKAHYTQLRGEYLIDRSKVIIGGFSAGTRASLYAVLTGAIEVRGLILNGCWLPELKEWEPMFATLKEKGIKFYIICGDKDEISLDSTLQLTELLKENGIEYILHIIDGMGHAYPENFERYIEEAINFIM